MLFGKKEYRQAAVQYRSFLERNPASDLAESGWFQMGESYRLGGQVKEARIAFRQMVEKYRRGSKVADASYRLGILNFNAEDFDNAVMDFELASREADSPKVKYQAKYFNARSLQKLGKTDLALALYDQLIRTNPGTDTNHFQEKSALETARIFSDRGDLEAAREHYRTLIETATTRSIREEAIVRSGLAEVTNGNIQEGEKILKNASTFHKDSPWKSLAQVGALFAAYAKKEYGRVVAIYSSGNIISAAGEYRPKVLLMVADAFRAEGDAKAAERLYTLVEGRYSAGDSGIVAGYRRLSLLYHTNGSNVPSAVESFIESVRLREPGSDYIDKAYMMLAEWHFFQAEKGVSRKDRAFAETQYREAAKVYQKIRLDRVDEDLVPTLLYHQCWASMESGDTVVGAKAATDLIEKFPESTLVPEALAKRGETFLLKEDFTSALADFETVISRYPSSRPVELALERRARIYAHKRKTAETIASYEELLQRFPNTGGRAEAHFWIGDGYFELQKYREAIPHFVAARNLDPEGYANKSGVRLVMSHYSLQQVPEMTAAARMYIQSGRDAGALNSKQKTDRPLEIPQHVLLYLGEKLVDKNQYSDAEFFLNQIVDLDQPEKCPSAAWKVWAGVKLELKEYSAAIRGYDHYLVRTKSGGERGFAYIRRGQAQYALKQYDRARRSAQECIRVVKQGRINAEARLLIGDIEVAEGNPDLAAIEYDLVSRIFDDPTITPLALKKAIEVQRKMGNQEDVVRIEGALLERSEAARRY